jgi:MHS family proline/betaine transporter-like MFS transporter
MGSFAFFGSQIGILLNIIECYILDNVLTRQQLLDWGWRCSFMIGGIIGLIGLFLRYQLKETPLFLTLEQQDHIAKAPLHKLFKECKYKMIMALFVGALPIGGFYQIFVFTSIYLEEFFRLTSNQGLLLNGAFLLVSTSILPFVGKLSSKFSIKKLFIHSALYVCALAFPFYLFVIRGYFPAAILMALLMVLCISVQFALISQAMAGLFSTSVRFTGLALSYNCSNIIFAGAFPLFSIFIVKMTGFLYAPAFSIFILALISCLTVIRLKQRGGELEVQNG